MQSRRVILRKLRRKNKNRNKNRLAFVIFILVFFLTISVFLAWLSWSEKVKITRVVVYGNSMIDESDIKSVVNEELGGGYLGVFSKSNVFIYPKKKIYNKLINKYKRILKLDIYTKNLNFVIVKIKEREVDSMWCGGQISKSDERLKSCYFLDREGFIFSPAPYFSGNVFFEFYGDIESNKSDVIGNYFLGIDEFKRISLLRAGIEDLGLSLVAFEIDGEENYIFYIKNSGKIFFNKEQDFSLSLNNLDSALSDILSLNKKLDYIDLRFGNKVFYKFTE